ncbi:MAG: hypothetical protein Q9182_005545 [Xanthomendoza sp. 2 TL-2023]
MIQFSGEEIAIFKHSIERIDYAHDQPGTGNNDCGMTPRVHSALTIFRSFSGYIQSYPRINPASPTSLFDLRSETRAYILHHLNQLEDKRRPPHQSPQSSPQRSTMSLTPLTSYVHWVHTSGAGHVSGPWFFSFFCCIISSTVRGGRDCFSTVKQKLMAYKMNNHIGAFCRMYNNHGSIESDMENGSLDSVKFVEFNHGVNGENQSEEERKEGLERVKKTLLEGAAYERGFALQVAEELYADLEKEEKEGKSVVESLRVYMGACEQFSDMYFTRDATDSAQ